MKITIGFVGREQALIELFAATFTASEGPGEGALIGDLVSDLLAETPTEDIRVFCAEDEGHAIGAAIFTRLTYSEDPHVVFLLSPMAVAPERQRRGIGQALLSQAFEALRSECIQIVITYGDPNYYGRVGIHANHRRSCPRAAAAQVTSWVDRTVSDRKADASPSRAIDLCIRIEL